MNHPSFFELDAWALGAPPTEELRLHVHECAECAAHLARVAPDQGGLPSWISQLDGTSRSRRRTGRLHGWTVGAALAAAAVVLVMVGLNQPGAPPADPTEQAAASTRAPREHGAPSALDAAGREPLSAESPEKKELPSGRQDESDKVGSGRPERNAERMYLASKGAPHVKIVIKRRESLFVWRDEQAIQPGDRFMLHLAPSGYREVGVLGSTGGQFGTLYQGSIPEDGKLPRAWEIDEEAGAERLVVVLSDAVLSKDELEAAVAGRTLGQRLWVQEVVLPKLVRP